MNIRVDLNTPIQDGTEVVFRSPVDCSQVTGLKVYYPENGVTVSKEFAFADAHGNNVGDIDHLFAENVVVKVILDVTSGMAFVQNADTNAYLEGRFTEVVTHTQQKLTEEQKAQARANIGAAKAGPSGSDDTDYSVYFNIDVDGVVSLKSDYSANGELNAELPEVLIIPDVVNDIAVSALSEKMFNGNVRVKSITIPSHITVIPKSFANKAVNLTEVNGTENIEVIEYLAFQKCGIKKALFPSLKKFDRYAQFNQAADLVVVDIGDNITTIPQNCFSSCDKLTRFFGGSSVVNIGDSAYQGTRSLKNLSFLDNVKKIGNKAFLLSRVTGTGVGKFDWWTFKPTLSPDSGTNAATPAHFNPSDWWSGCTYTACENPLGSTFHQKNLSWATNFIPNSVDTYGDGCTEISAAHIYSAFKEPNLSSPVHFVENIVGGIDNGRLLTPTGVDEDGKPVYSFADMANWLSALGLQCELLTYNNDNLKQIYADLADGALVLTWIEPGHAGVIYGVAENGEMLILDSNGYNYNLNDYTARTYQQPIWSFAPSGKAAVIVKKKEEE